ncbi:MAG: hypothetical protein ACN6QE_22360 [Pseudomonas putida]
MSANNFPLVMLLLWAFSMPAYSEPEEQPEAPGLDALTIDCKVAEPLLGKSYERIREALMAGDSTAATLYSKSFWDIYSFSESCTGIQPLADTLMGISSTHPDAQVAYSKPKPDPLTVKTASPLCSNPPCTFSRGGGGISVGREPLSDQLIRQLPNRDIYIENPGKSSGLKRE